MELAEYVSPTTGKPFVTLATLQAAHWSQSVLRQHIVRHLARSPSGNPLFTESEALLTRLARAIPCGAGTAWIRTEIMVADWLD